MKKFQFSQDLDIDPQRSWDLFFDVEFNVALCKALNLAEYTLLGFNEDDSTLKIERRYITGREVPKAIKRMTGASKLGYVTNETWNKEKGSMDWIFIPTIFDDGVQGSGQIVSEALPNGGTRRTFKGIIDADIPFIGAQLENRLAEVIGESFQKGSGIMREWVAKEKADLAAGRPGLILTRPTMP